MDGKAGTTKRKRKVLTIGTKVEILKELKHQSASSLEKQYGVGVFTVCDIKKNKEKIRSFYLSVEKKGQGDKRKAMKKATDEQLDEAGKLARKLSCEQFPYLFIFCHCMHSISVVYTDEN